MSSGTTKKRACACTCVLWVLRGDRTGWSDPQPLGQTYRVTSPHSLCNSDTPFTVLGVCSPTSVCWNEESSSVPLGHTRCCDPSGEEGDTIACLLSMQELTLWKRCARECQVCPWRAETWRGHGCASPDGMGPNKLPATLCLYRVTAAERPVGRQSLTFRSRWTTPI